MLAGVDDGARDLAESLAIARVAVADGITSIAATPHVRDDYPTSPETMERLVAELRHEIEREQIPIEVLPGGELALRQALELPDDDLVEAAARSAMGHAISALPAHLRQLARRRREEYLSDLARSHRDGASRK